MSNIMVSKGIERDRHLLTKEQKKDPCTHDIQIICLDEYNLKLLQTIEDGNQYNFHSLVDMEELRGVDEINVKSLLYNMEQQLDAHPELCDAIATYIDFPAVDLMAYLTDKYKLSGPTLEGVLRCNHKYWSRLIQQQVIDEHIPDFYAFDPYSDDPMSDIKLKYPFWIKPVNSYRSHLGFRINNRESFEEAISTIREELPRIAEPFKQIMSLAVLPERIARLGPNVCMAEQIISGSQCTLEGYSYHGKVEIYGVVDSIRGANRSSFERYQYPSELELPVQEKMIEISKKVVPALELDNSAFNIEFFYNREEEKIWFLEINPRISQSHCELFRDVDGSTHHKVMLDLALGKKPEMPYRKGKYNIAAKFFVRSYEDGVISRAPSEEDLEAIQHAVPGVSVSVEVQEGDRLSELTDQDSYSYELGHIWIGAEDRQKLKEKYDLCVKLLDFRMEIKKP